jgi:hypothetical protein
VKGKGESEAENYDEASALHAEVKALREANEEGGTHQGELAAQIDEIESLKAENVSEARNNAEELAALLDKIRTLREAKESEPHNDHGELAHGLRKSRRRFSKHSSPSSIPTRSRNRSSEPVL